jgi:hypothetical protein
LHGKSTGHIVQVESETVDSPLSTPNTTGKKKTPLPPHTRKKGGPFTPEHNFSRVAWKFYS